MTEQAERNAEIWGTRIQQELLGLTTDNGEDKETEARTMLPAFTSIVNHHLDLGNHTCLLDIQVDIQNEYNNTHTLVVEVEASQKNSNSYPFEAPMARLKSGQEQFPEGSTIQNGDTIGMDLDWTPSLHLADVIMNIGLKIKESILQKEPFHAADKQTDVLAEAVDEVAKEISKGARMFVGKLGEKASSLSKAFTSPKNGSPRSGAKVRRAKASPTNIQIGQEINWLEEPWNNAHGIYSCKALRRPSFVQAIMNANQEKTAGAMFRSFANSARSVMEESFLMVTDTYIIELKASKLNMQNIGTVTFFIPIEAMAKLKFRRQESLSLFFKPAPDDPLVYMCPDSGDAVHQIQSVLKRKGVRGKHTNASAYRAINEAMLMVQDIQTKEIAVEHEPSVDRVNEIMDLYRQAAEKFETAGDIRHEEVISHMRMFLAKPSTMAVLDGSFKKQQEESEQAPPTEAAVKEESKPLGEILDRSDADLNAQDDEKQDSPEKDNEFAANIDDIIKDAKEDFTFSLDDPEDEDDLTPADTSGDDLADMAADLDAMMKEADKELAELMGS